MTDTEVTDTATTVGNIVQLTEAPAPTRHWTWHAPLVEDVVTFGTLPDPRDARIAELEAALRDVQRACVDGQFISEDGMRAMFVGLHRFIGAALVWSPERDMSITVEELEA